MRALPRSSTGNVAENRSNERRLALEQRCDAAALAAGGLPLADPQRAAAASDGDAVIVRRDHGARRGAAVDGPSAPQLDGLAGKHRAGTGKRIEGANAARDEVGWIAPIDDGFGLVDLARIRRADARLWRANESAAICQLERLDDHASAEIGEAVVQGCGGVVGRDRDRL